MGFFERILKGKIYSGTRIPKMVCELNINGERYMLAEFDINIDKEGNGNYISLYAVFQEKISPSLENWIMRDSVRNDGHVRFYRNNDTIEEGVVFSLEFFEASCVKYRKVTTGGVPFTTLVLSARRVRLQGEDY